jgi:hypothetical protein
VARWWNGTDRGNCSMARWWNGTDRGNCLTGRRNRPSATLSTTSHMPLSVLGSNSGLRGERPPTKRRSRGPVCYIFMSEDYVPCAVRAEYSCVTEGNSA